jgi:hypothetical protein
MPSEVFESLIVRIQSEYLEMPGLRLTAEQGRRLWGLDPDRCDEVLNTLVKRRFLSIGEDGKYGRPSETPRRLTSAKAFLGDSPADARATPRAVATTDHRRVRR